MSHLNVTSPPFNDPLAQNWTINRLLERVAADETLIDRIDPELLRRIDEALDHATAEQGRPPGPVARVRSIVAALQKDPAASELRISELVSPAAEPTLLRATAAVRAA